MQAINHDALLRLAKFLRNDERVKDHFNMRAWIIDPNDKMTNATMEFWFKGEADNSETVEHILAPENQCNTAACVAGWAWLNAHELGMERTLYIEDQADELIDYETHPLKNNFIFDSDWPNDPIKAAERIEHLVHSGESPPVSEWPQWGYEPY